MAEDMNKSAAETEEEYQPDLMTLEDEDGSSQYAARTGTTQRSHFVL